MIHADARSRFTFLCCLCIILTGLAIVSSCASPEPTQAQEIVFYRNIPVIGEFSLFSLVTVSVRADGTVNVLRQPWCKDPLKSVITLDNSEIDALRDMIKKTGFAALPELEPSIEGTRLELTMDGKTRGFVFHSVPKELKSVLHYIGLLFGQAEVLDRVKLNGDTYAALGAVNPRLGGPKIAQPMVLTEPLQEYVKTGTDSSQLRYAVDALRWLMAPSDWAAFLTKVWSQSDAGHRILLIHTMAPHTLVNRNIPADYSQALKGLHIQMRTDAAALELSVSDRILLGSTAE